MQAETKGIDRLFGAFSVRSEMTLNHDLQTTSHSSPLDRTVETGLIINGASVRGLRDVAALQSEAFRQPLAYRWTTLLVLKLLPNVHFLVAKSNGRIVGCAIGDTQNGQSRVINICVDPRVRRRGVATRLLRELELKLPRGNVVLMVEQANLAAREFYRREGYLPATVSRGYYGRGLDGLWMQKYRTPNPPQKIRI